MAGAASYFDVDGTLVKTNLFDTLLFYVMNQQSPILGAGRMFKTIASVPALIAAEQIDRGTFNEWLFKGYTGISEDRLLDLADEAFDTVMRPALYKGAIDLVKRAKSAGHRVVLLS